MIAIIKVFHLQLLSHSLHNIAYQSCLYSFYVSPSRIKFIVKEAFYIWSREYIFHNFSQDISYWPTQLPIELDSWIFLLFCRLFEYLIDTRISVNIADFYGWIISANLRVDVLKSWMNKLPIVVVELKTEIGLVRKVYSSHKFL